MFSNSIFFVLIIFHFFIMIISNSFMDISSKNDYYLEVFRKSFPLFNKLRFFIFIIPIVCIMIFWFFGYSLKNLPVLLNTNDMMPYKYIIGISLSFMGILLVITFKEYITMDPELKEVNPNIGFYLLIYIYAISVFSSLFIVYSLNFALDSSTPIVRVVTVTDKKWSSHKYRKKNGGTEEVFTFTCYINPAIGGSNNFQVEEKLFDIIEKGDKFKYYIKNGYFAIPYIAKRQFIKKSDFYKDDIDNNIKVMIPSILANMVECPHGLSEKFTKEQLKYIKTYYIGKYEITQKEYETVFGPHPTSFKGDNFPVNGVRYIDAKNFCDKLNSFRNLIPEGYKFDLPTQQQWIFACTAGKYDSVKNLDEVAWYYMNSNETTHPVGLKKPNAWGIYDMLGNVDEWCNDCDFCGGSFRSQAKECSPTNVRNYKDKYSPKHFAFDNNGFRVALVPDTP